MTMPPGESLSKKITDHPAPNQGGDANRRIAVTGGPGGGKTTALDLFRREIGDRVVVVPEAATLLFSGGFPRSSLPGPTFAAQRAIYHVQRNLEAAQGELYPDRILLCDRGTVDGAVYWPDGPKGFFAALETTMESELKRYDAVIFFESAAVGGMSIEGGNPVRIESIYAARELDTRARELWSHHPRFTFIPHRESFMQKITRGVETLRELVLELSPSASSPSSTP